MFLSKSLSIEKAAIFACDDDDLDAYFYHAQLQEEIEEAAASKPKTTRKRRKIDFQHYNNSAWSVQLRNPDLDDPTSSAAALFRRRHRIPYAIFKQILKLAEAWFPPAIREGAAARFGTVVVPMQLKILGVLRTLGRGQCFDTSAEFSNASEETHRVFFPIFMERFVTELKPVYIKMPETPDVSFK